MPCPVNTFLADIIDVVEGAIDGRPSRLLSEPLTVCSVTFRESVYFYSKQPQTEQELT